MAQQQDEEAQDDETLQKPTWNRGPAFMRPNCAAISKEGVCPLVRDMHIEMGDKGPLTEGQLRSVLYATAVWHGADVCMAPYPFELTVPCFCSFQLPLI